MGIASYVLKWSIMTLAMATNGSASARPQIPKTTPSAASENAAATAVNAKILGKEDELGSIRPGYFADLIAVTGQPAENIAALANPCFIMNNGAVASG